MMGWTDIADSAIDAESPVTSSLWTQYRDNSDYNYEHALRGGTDGTGVRLVMARGSFTLSNTGSSGNLSQAVTFATDADDGDPDFSAAPRVVMTIYQNADDGDFWSGNTVRITRMMIQDGTLDANGFTAECCYTASASMTFRATVSWLAVGAVNSETGFTTIAGTDTDQDSPADETYTEELRDNQKYNYDRALRCGTHKHGVRLAIARGAAQFGLTDPGALDFVTVTFASDADDGDPGFASPPVVLIGLEEFIGAYSTYTGVDWTTAGGIVEYFHISESDSGAAPAITADDFQYSVKIADAATSDFCGYVHWIAIGPVTAGE